MDEWVVTQVLVTRAASDNEDQLCHLYPSIPSRLGSRAKSKGGQWIDTIANGKKKKLQMTAFRSGREVVELIPVIIKRPRLVPLQASGIPTDQ